MVLILSAQGRYLGIYTYLSKNSQLLQVFSVTSPNGQVRRATARNYLHTFLYRVSIIHRHDGPGAQCPPSLPRYVQIKPPSVFFFLRPQGDRI